MCDKNDGSIYVFVLYIQHLDYTEFEFLGRIDKKPNQKPIYKTNMTEKCKIKGQVLGRNRKKGSVNMQDRQQRIGIYSEKTDKDGKKKQKHKN